MWTSWEWTYMQIMTFPSLETGHWNVIAITGKIKISSTISPIHFDQDDLFVFHSNSILFVTHNLKQAYGENFKNFFV